MLNHSPPAARYLPLPMATPATPTFIPSSERARIRFWFAAALLAADFLEMSFNPSNSSAGTSWWQHEYKTLYNAAIHAFVWWASMYLADLVSSTRMSPKAAYALACLVATAVSIAIWMDFYSAFSDISRNHWLNLWWQITLYTLWKFALATSAYVYFQHGQSGRSTLQRLRLERVQVIRRSTEAQLQAMQARINPQFLFATLEDVERRCDTDPDAADHVLGCLIAYLRASTPVSGESTYTIEAEFALVQTYLDLVEARNRPRFAYGIELSPDARNALLPAMLLLPLVEHATLVALRKPGFASVLLRADLDVNRRRLIVTARFTDTEFGRDIDNAMPALGKRLDELFGKSASFTSADAETGMTKLVMEIPDERTERSNR